MSWGFSTSTGQSKTLGENSWRFYSATGELRAVLGAGAVIDHAGLTNLTTGDPHTQYQEEDEKNAANGYAGLSSVSRTIKGVDATDDLIVDNATKGLVLKDTQGTPHYWRITVTTLGTLTVSDLGTTKP